MKLELKFIKMIVMYQTNFYNQYQNLFNKQKNYKNWKYNYVFLIIMN